MNKTAFLSGLGAFVITLATSLTTLWSQTGIANFADVPPVAYGAAACGACIAFVSQYRARNAQRPVTETV